PCRSSLGPSLWSRSARSLVGSPPTAGRALLSCFRSARCLVGSSPTTAGRALRSCSRPRPSRTSARSASGSLGTTAAKAVRASTSRQASSRTTTSRSSSAVKRGSSASITPPAWGSQSYFGFRSTVSVAAVR
ncbi:unnamed protein product, partial [Heterosigma akashiwo]